MILLYIGSAIVAVSCSFAYGGDADSPLGDGIILGLLLLAVPLWPITMPFWTWYILTRHRDATAERARRAAALIPATRRPPPSIPYGFVGPDLRAAVPRRRPTEPCATCGAREWSQASPIRHRFGTAGCSFLCTHCGATRNFDIDGADWVPSFPARRSDDRS